MIVYLVRCKVNGKGYIGKTKRSLHDRWRAHRAKGSGCWGLKGAIQKYGKDAFEVSVLASGLSDDEASAMEKNMIHVHRTKAPLGYNLTEGGQGSAHKNPEHGKNIAKAWERPESREKHMAWRTHEKLSAQANSDGTWRRQQKAWMDKRLEEALRMPPLDGARSIWHKTTKNREHAKRKGRSDTQLEWIDSVRDAQIATIWASAGVPAPPASSWQQTAHAYEKSRWGCVRDDTLTKSRPSAACEGEGTSEDRSWMIPSDPED